MPYFVYIIECANKALYTGITTDLKRRFGEHKKGKGCRYTAYNPAVKLRYSEKHRTRSAAAKREAEIKGWPRAKKLSLIHCFYPAPGLELRQVRQNAGRFQE